MQVVFTVTVCHSARTIASISLRIIGMGRVGSAGRDFRFCNITGIHVNPPVCSLMQFLNFELSSLVQRISQMGAPDKPIYHIYLSCCALGWYRHSNDWGWFPLPCDFGICIKELVHQAIRWPCV